jgi:hypothetical protein
VEKCDAEMGKPMTELDKIRAMKLKRLPELIDEGLASGSEEMAPDEFEQIKRKGRALLPARAASKTDRRS